jgi:hypothetical protein
VSSTRRENFNPPAAGIIWAKALGQVVHAF